MRMLNKKLQPRASSIRKKHMKKSFLMTT